MGVNIEKVFGENVFDDSVMKVILRELKLLCMKVEK